jgi:hypothetical protein
MSGRSAELLRQMIAVALGAMRPVVATDEQLEIGLAIETTVFV